MRSAEKFHWFDGTRLSRARFRILLAGILLSSTVMVLPAQPLMVRWVCQYPDPEQPEEIRVRERLAALVFGKNNTGVVRPFGVLAEDTTHYWILDQGSGSIAEVRDGEGRFLPEIRRAGEDFSSLVGICRLPGGGLLFTDSRLNRIFEVSEREIIPFGDSLLVQPTGIAYSEFSDEIWVVETGSHRISVLNRDGKLIRTIGGRGTAPGEFNFPTFLCIGSDGNVYIVDSMNFRIQVLDGMGNFLYSFGESGDGTGDMARPKGVATDSYGNIYVVDALFHAVQIFDREGTLLYTFGRQGQDQGSFWMPSGIYVDKQDYIYVADGYNSRVQIFKLEQQ